MRKFMVGLGIFTGCVSIFLVAHGVHVAKNSILALIDFGCAIYWYYQ